MKITTVSLLNNIPISSWWTSLSFFVNNILWKNSELTFLYFHQEEDRKGFIPKSNSFSSRFISKSFKFPLFPTLLQKMSFEFLFSQKALKGIKTDIVLLEFPYLYHIAKIISRNNNNCPIYLLEHNIEWKYYKADWSKIWRLIKIFEQYVIKHVSKVIAISPNDFSFLQKQWLNSNITLLEPWVLTDIYSPEGNVFNFNNGKFNILFYGSLNTAMNKYALEYIYHELSETLPNDYFIHIGGKNVSKFIDKKQLQFLGFVPRIDDYIRGADVVIIPIKNGAWVKIRLLESLYCGKVVLASKEALEGLPQILRTVVFECNSSEEYLKILEKLRWNLQYKSDCEKRVREAVTLYIEDNEKKVSDIFIQQK